LDGLGFQKKKPMFVLKNPQTHPSSKRGDTPMLVLTSAHNYKETKYISDFQLKKIPPDAPVVYNILVLESTMGH
jgi:hypothetical protein